MQCFSLIQFSNLLEQSPLSPVLHAQVEPTPGNVSTTAMTEAKAEAAAADAKAMACAESTCAKAARDTDK